MTFSSSSPGGPALLAAFDAVDERLNDAADAALFGLTGDELWKGIMQVRRVAARVDAVGLGLVAEAAGRDLANLAGAPGDTAGLLRSRVLFTPAEAKRRVQIARSLGRDDLAATRTALGHGLIDLDQAGILVDTVRAMGKARVDPDVMASAQDCLLGYARRFDPTGLARLARLLLACVLPDREKKSQRRAREGRRFTMRNRGDGTHALSGSLDDASAVLLAACLDPLAAPQPGVNGERDPRPAAMRHADALIELAGQYVRYGPRDHDGADHPADHTCPTAGGADCDHTCSAHPGNANRDTTTGQDGNPDSDGDDLGFPDPDSLYDPGFPHDQADHDHEHEDDDEDSDNDADPDGPGDTDGAGGSGGQGSHGGDTARHGHGHPGHRPGNPPARAASRTAPRPGGAQLLVTCNLRSLTGPDDGTFFGPETINHIPLTRATLERFTCEGTVRRIVLDPKSVPLDVGRRSRTVTPAIRAAVILRDRHCTFPYCDRPASWSDCHHAHHWTKGGETSLTNIVLACTSHHDKAHHGWDVRIGPHGRAEWRAPHHEDPTGTWHTNQLRQPRHPYDKPLKT
jgi:Domain of unknown function (DUF222)/HNH endonuclease